MNDVELRTAIMAALLLRRRTDARSGAVEVAALAREVGAPAVKVAVVCADLSRHGHVDGEADGNMMGFVRLSEAGVAYCESVEELHR